LQYRFGRGRPLGVAGGRGRTRQVLSDFEEGRAGQLGAGAFEGVMEHRARLESERKYSRSLPRRARKYFNNILQRNRFTLK
jgi:hypothetical protein